MKRCLVVLMSCVFKLFWVYQGTFFFHRYSCVMFVLFFSTGAQPDWHGIYGGGDKRKCRIKGTLMIIQHLNLVRAACSLITLTKPSQGFLYSGWREAFWWDVLLSLIGWLLFSFFFYSNRDNEQEESAKA